MSELTANRAMEILLVEDNPGDVYLMTRSLEQGNVPKNISVVGDGVAVLAFLRRQGEYVDAVRPDLVILDLNLPRKNGREVLAEIREDPNLRGLPVLVLSSSKAPEDILNAYTLHANCYIVKPLLLSDFRSAITSIEDFWLKTAQLPPM
jgi:CheY-like chemotaxis protein